MAFQFTTTDRDQWNTDLITSLGSGAIYNVYSNGSNGAPPANVAASLAGYVLLASLSVTGAFGTTTGGVITLTNAATNNAVATGTATFARITTSGGTGKVQGTVGTSGADITISNTAVVSGTPVSMLGTNTLTAPGA